MRKSVRLLSVLLLCLAVIGFVLVPVAGANKAHRYLRIRLPKSIRPEDVTLSVWTYSKQSRTLQSIRTIAGQYTYSFKISDGATSLDIDFHHPLYKTTTTTLSAKDAASKPFVPKLQSVPMFPLTLKLINTKGKPMADEQIALTEFRLGRAGPNGIYSGPAYKVTLATAVTDSAGIARVSVARMGSLAGFDVEHHTPPNMMSYGGECQEPVQGGYDWPAVHVTVEFDKVKSKPIPVIVIYNGQIVGRVERSFLAARKISMKSVTGLEIRGANGYCCGLGRPDDRRYSQMVLPGRYDVVLRVSQGGSKPSLVVPIRKGVLVLERQTTFVKS